MCVAKRTAVLSAFLALSSEEKEWFFAELSQDFTMPRAVREIAEEARAALQNAAFRSASEQSAWRSLS